MYVRRSNKYILIRLLFVDYVDYLLLSLVMYYYSILVNPHITQHLYAISFSITIITLTNKNIAMKIEAFFTIKYFFIYHSFVYCEQPEKTYSCCEAKKAHINPYKRFPIIPL
jgi:hypothetical protein